MSKEFPGNLEIAGVDLKHMMKNHLCTNGLGRQDLTSCTQNHRKDGIGVAINCSNAVQVRAINQFELNLTSGMLRRMENSDQNVREKKPNTKDNIKLQQA